MLSKYEIARLYREWAPVNEHGEGETQTFIEGFRDMLGLGVDEYGQPAVHPKTSDGVPRLRPEEVGIRALTEGILGPDWERIVNPQSTGRTVLAEAGQAVLPGSFRNISAYSSAVGGLLEVKVLEAYNSPKYIANRIARTIQTTQRSEKLPGVAALGDAALAMDPGQPHPRLQLEERWVQTPETQYAGAAMDVTKHAIFFDLTNQIYERATNVGDTLILRKEKKAADVLLGVVNPYNYNGTAYNTYLTTGNWINTLANNLIDWTDIDEVMTLFAEMRDQEKQEMITVMPDLLITMPQKRLTANRILRATNAEGRVAKTVTTPGSVEVVHGNNPIAGMFDQIDSQIVYQRATDATGANLSAAAARQRWWLIDSSGFLAYMQNWPLTVRRADANDYQMLDQNLVFSIFANEYGVMTVREPRKGVMCTAE